MKLSKRKPSSDKLPLPLVQQVIPLIFSGIMARAKKTSKAVEKSKTRMSGLESIDPNMDFGNGISLVGYRETMNNVNVRLNDYNMSLSNADEKQNIFQASEKELKDIYERMLSGVGTRYGFDSNEYEKAGGKKKSDRKRPVRTKKVVA